MLLSALREAFSFFWQHFTELLWRLIPVMLPLLVLTNYRIVAVHQGDITLAIQDVWVLLPQAASSLAALAFTLVYARSVTQSLPLTLPALWWRAFKRLPFLAVAHILLLLTLFLLPMLLVWLAPQVNTTVQTVLSFLLLLCVWPLLFLMGALVPAYVLVVHEGRGPISALRQSWSRYRECAWALSAGVCGVFAVILVALFGLQNLESTAQFAPFATRIAALSLVDLVALQFMQLIPLFIFKFYSAHETAVKTALENSDRLEK